jgi:hypothetical protein
MVVTIPIVYMMIVMTGFKMTTPIVYMRIMMTGFKMTTTGLDSNGSKTESTCSFNMKSNYDSDKKYADDETSKCHPRELIFEVDRTRRYSDESTHSSKQFLL